MGVKITNMGMMTLSTVFIWRGGVRHWAAFDEPRHIVRPASARFIGPAPDRARPLRLVDEDAWSGLTLLRTAHALRSAGWEVAELAANTCVALDMAATGAPFRALDPLPPERPLKVPRRAGLPGARLAPPADPAIDDIIDEHPVRTLRRPDGSAVCMTAVWRVCGPWQAVYYAAAMLAHAIGAETRTATLFSDFSNQPALSDPDWYWREGWLVPVAAG